MVFNEWPSFLLLLTFSSVQLCGFLNARIKEVVADDWREDTVLNEASTAFMNSDLMQLFSIMPGNIQQLRVVHERNVAEINSRIQEIYGEQWSISLGVMFTYNDRNRGGTAQEQYHIDRGVIDFQIDLRGPEGHQRVIVESHITFYFEYNCQI